MVFDRTRRRPRHSPSPWLPPASAPRGCSSHVPLCAWSPQAAVRPVRLTVLQIAHPDGGLAFVRVFASVAVRVCPAVGPGPSGGPSLMPRPAGVVPRRGARVRPSAPCSPGQSAGSGFGLSRAYPVTPGLRVGRWVRSACPTITSGLLGPYPSRLAVWRAAGSRLPGSPSRSYPSLSWKPGRSSRTGRVPGSVSESRCQCWAPVLCLPGRLTKPSIPTAASSGRCKIFVSREVTAHSDHTVCISNWGIAPIRSQSGRGPVTRIDDVALAAAAASALAPPRPRARSKASALGPEFLAWGKTVSLRRSRLAHGCESVGRASSRYPSCIGCKSLNKVAWLGINVPKAKRSRVATWLRVARRSGCGLAGALRRRRAAVESPPLIPSLPSHVRGFRGGSRGPSFAPLLLTPLFVAPDSLTLLSPYVTITYLP